MRTSRAILCMTGGATLAALALGGISLLGPPADDAAPPKFALAIVLLAGFWLAYLTLMISVLVWVARLVLGDGGRNSRPGGEVE
jgi:hypothetical protein